MSELDEELIQNLRRSREILGEIDEVIIDQNGQPIDGAHRLKAYPGWKTRTVNVDRKKAILIRLHRNYRRVVSKEETKRLLYELALQLKSEGVPDQQIASEVVRLSPYSPQYTLRLLPKKFKKTEKVETGKKAAQQTFKASYKEEQLKEETTSITPVTQVQLMEKPKEEAKPTPKQKFLLCPVCGSRLILKGDLLFRV
jgi:hypothetical protein